MSGYVLVGRQREGREPDPIGVASLDDHECRALTGVLGVKAGIDVKGIDSTDYDTLKAVGVTEWTYRQLLGTEPEPMGAQ